jgi:hypothetical protein
MFINIILTLIILILILCLFIVLFDIYQVYNIEYINQEVTNYVTENIKHSKEFKNIYTKRFLFSPFVELFNGTYTNFPSKFVDINSNDLNELISLLNNQDVISDKNTSLMKTISILNNRLKEYESILYDIFDMSVSQLKEIEKHKG